MEYLYLHPPASMGESAMAIVTFSFLAYSGYFLSMIIHDMATALNLSFDKIKKAFSQSSCIHSEKLHYSVPLRLDGHRPAG